MNHGKVEHKGASLIIEWMDDESYYGKESVQYEDILYSWQE